MTTLSTIGLVLMMMLCFEFGCSFDRTGLAGKLDCVGHEDCGLDQVCVEGRCAEDVGCLGDEDCAAGQRCVESTCVNDLSDVSFDTPRPDINLPDFVFDDMDGDPDIVVDAPADLEEDAPDVSDAEVVEDADLDRADAMDVVADPDTPNDVDVTIEPELADFDTTELDVVQDPDAEPDASDVDAGPDLTVPTFADLPAEAPEGTSALVTELDQIFRYSVAVERWLYDWFYDLSPEVDIEMSGDVLPVSEGWTQRATGGGTLSVEEGGVAFDGSGDDQQRSWAFFDHGSSGVNLWFSGVFSVTGSRGAGLFRHTVDIRNQDRAVVVNLATGEDGIRLAAGGDVSLGTVLLTEFAATPRQIDAFLFTGDRAELYVDQRLVQSVPYSELLASGLSLYQIGDSVTTGGGLITVRNALFGSFGP